MKALLLIADHLRGRRRKLTGFDSLPKNLLESKCSEVQQLCVINLAQTSDALLTPADALDIAGAA